MRIDGNVTTGILGADAEWGRMLAGVAVSVSEGEGTFAQPGVDSGSIESTMTTVSPYARMALSDRVSAWGLMGYGTGDMTIVQKANEATGQPERITRTDLSMRLAALGGRGALLTADESRRLRPRAQGGRLLRRGPRPRRSPTRAIRRRMRAGCALRSKAAARSRWVMACSRRAWSSGCAMTAATPRPARASSSAGGCRTRTRRRVSASRRTSAPSLRTRTRSTREWGASGAVRLAPSERGRGLSFSLAPTYGTAGSGVDRLWSARDARGLAPTGGTFEPESRLEGELGYGLPLLGDRFTGTPNVASGSRAPARATTGSAGG